MNIRVMLASCAVVVMAVAPVAASATAHEAVAASVQASPAGDAAGSDARHHAPKKASLLSDPNAWLLAALGVAGLTFALTTGHSSSAPQPVSP